jgi:hypothetical protein
VSPPGHLPYWSTRVRKPHWSLMTRGAARRRIWWHREIRGHRQDVHRFEVPSSSILGRLIFCSCGEVWCL